MGALHLSTARDARRRPCENHLHDGCLHRNRPRDDRPRDSGRHPADAPDAREAAIHAGFWCVLEDGGAMRSTYDRTAVRFRKKKGIVLGKSGAVRQSSNTTGAASSLRPPAPPGNRPLPQRALPAGSRRTRSWSPRPPMVRTRRRGPAGRRSSRCRARAARGPRSVAGDFPWRWSGGSPGDRSLRVRSHRQETIERNPCSHCRRDRSASRRRGLFGAWQWPEARRCLTDDDLREAISIEVRNCRVIYSILTRIEVPAYGSVGVEAGHDPGPRNHCLEIAVAAQIDKCRGRQFVTPTKLQPSFPLPSTV